MTSKTCGCSIASCGCCEGTQQLTPSPVASRPGLDALAYRAGTHGTFLETMKARLATMSIDAPGADGQTLETFYPLRGLTTRDSGDPAIALLDSWATVGDVLTFYQERIANEGYLRTATERRSILELARLVGYTLRPGVASTVYLAYTLDDNQIDPVEIPIGARAQSIPGPDELPQSFETSDKLLARSLWNNLQVRRQRPQKITLVGAPTLEMIYLDGTSTNLKTGDRLLLVFDEEGEKSVLRNVAHIESQFEDKRTAVHLLMEQQQEVDRVTTHPTKFVTDLLKPPIRQASDTLQLRRNLGLAFKKGADVHPQLLVNFAPGLKDTYYAAWANAEVNDAAPELKAVYALRAAASLFGANAPQKVTFPSDSTTDGNLVTVKSISVSIEEWNLEEDETPNTLFLDHAYDEILPGSYILIQGGGLTNSGVRRVKSAETKQRAAYGISGKTTQLTVAPDWRRVTSDEKLSTLRSTVVFAQSEELRLAEMPISDHVTGQTIELGGLYNELTSGRWLIFSGERADIEGVSGVKASELLMISGLKHGYDANLPGDKTHTTLLLATTTAYTYKRGTLTIYGNVVKATHGETRNETLGSGDGSQALQAFGLKQPPVTFVPVATPEGVESTLKVYVNDVEWHETDALAGAKPTDRSFVAKTDDEGKTTLIFGNGEKGARLPTGIENVKAVYRQGIGKGGNVRAEQISLLQSRPLGVKGVINPLRASGGADKEGRDLARENAPLAVMALDRLVSVQDYADFTRTFAGIAKADARSLSDGKRELVHVTIAGADDIPIDRTSDLYRNLLIALHALGDPGMPIQVDLRELVVLVVHANVRLAPDYLWEPIATEIRTSLLDTFGFQRRALGQAVLLSEVVSLIQGIEGVAYVDVDAFGGIPEKTLDADGTRRLLTLEESALTVQIIVDPSKLFRLADLKDVSAFIDRLRAPGDPLTGDPLIDFLVTQFPEDLVQGIRESDDAAAATRAFADRVVNELNGVIIGAYIYTPERFPKVTDPALIKDPPPEGQDLVSLNRRLLEAAYPELVRKPDAPRPHAPADTVEVNVAALEGRSLRPAQLAIFTAAVPDTVILNEIK